MEQNSKPKHEVRTSSPHHKIILLSACQVISQKDPLNLKTWGNREKGFSCLPGLSTTAGPQTEAKAACLLPELYLLFPNYIGNHYRTVLHLTTMKTAGNSLNWTQKNKPWKTNKVPLSIQVHITWWFKKGQIKYHFSPNSKEDNQLTICETDKGNSLVFLK